MSLAAPEITPQSDLPAVLHWILDHRRTSDDRAKTQREWNERREEFEVLISTALDNYRTEQTRQGYRVAAICGASGALGAVLPLVLKMAVGA
ncbi:hypothetical protein LCGC14_1835400 [marine sediment metagenome]|uniref:Uncharacterized protein n=1 Tax=marine sediment metagenome TaxID=412755 RepID=A0A0F9JEE5_9ZZZZ